MLEHLCFDTFVGEIEPTVVALTLITVSVFLMKVVFRVFLELPDFFQSLDSGRQKLMFLDLKI